MCKILSVAAGTMLLIMAGCADTSADTTSNTPSDADRGARAEIPTSINIDKPGTEVASRDPHEGHDHDHDHDHDHIGGPPSEGAVFYVTAEPDVLDLGHVAPNEKPTGTVKLVNNGDTTFKILGCKANCGCTTANCPNNKVLAPGESTDVEVSVSTGAVAQTIKKQVTFTIEGHAPVILPVLAEVVSYVEVDPRVINKKQHPEGKIRVSSTDGQAFRILSADPPLVRALPEEAGASHEISLDWSAFEELNVAYRQLVLQLDHPKTNKIQAIIRGEMPVQPVTNPSLSRMRPMHDQLMIAVRSGDVEEVEQALAAIEDQDARNEALVAAARAGRIEIIDLLLDAGTDVNAADSRDRTALIAAVRQRQHRVTQHLLEKGADVNGEDRAQGTALAWAAGPFGDLATVRMLLEAGADVNVADTNQFTPLMWAARFGDAERVAALLDAGADALVKDSSGKTALDYAKARQDAGGKGILEVLESEQSDQ